MKNREALASLALTFAPQLGPVKIKRLVDHFGSAVAIIDLSSKDLGVIKGIGPSFMAQWNPKKWLHLAEEEMAFVDRHGIQLLTQRHADYPMRLKECSDAPLCLFAKGNVAPNPLRTVAVVGTRSCTAYGAQLTEQLIYDLRAFGVQVISGLAKGIDTHAHHAAVHCGLETCGVIAHGFGRPLYPAQNRKLMDQMVEKGGVLTEFTSQVPADREHFPQRNRIIAGMADVIVVVESAEKGGALITANLGCSYAREVVAFPGKSNDAKSLGCNRLIQEHKAALITCAQDIVELMSWEGQVEKKQDSASIPDLSEGAARVYTVLRKVDRMHLDELNRQNVVAVHELSSVLLELEIFGLLRLEPGNYLRLV